PHWQTWTDVVVQNKNLQFAPELAMVALFRFLDHREVFIEFLFRFEGRAVNALELRILFVAFVIRAGDAGKPEGADVSGTHHVRAGAEIDEIAVAIERDFFVRRNVFDDVDLKFARLLSIAQRGEAAFLAELER